MWNNPTKYTDPTGHCVLCMVDSETRDAYVDFVGDFTEAALSVPYEAAPVSTVKAIPQAIQEAPTVWTATKK